MIDEALRDQDPGAFAIVMATGICSIAAHTQGWTAISVGLLWIGAAVYALLLIATVARAVRHRGVMTLELLRGRTFGFFTLVAATAVLGARVILDGHVSAAVLLLGVAGALWLVLGYLLPAIVFGSNTAQPPMTRADGSWFVWPVATQSVAVLAAAVAARVDSGRDELALAAVFCWAVGVALYVAVAVFVAARLLIARPSARDVSEAYWVAMGATAITVVAGTGISSIGPAPVLDVVGGTVTDEVASRRLGSDHDLPVLDAIGHVEIWLALTAWAATFLALILSLARRRSC